MNRLHEIFHTLGLSHLNNMRKLKIIILLAFIIYNVESYSQDNINYFVKSDSMEVYLNNIIDVNYAKKFDSLFVYIHYDENNRINLNLGIYEGIDYKIKTAAEILNNKIGNNERGTLDLSAVPKENRSCFTPDY